MVRSLKGKNVDFSAMLAREEKTIAVTGGGDRMNARGDLIDRSGKILKTKEELDMQYNKSETSVKNVSLSNRKFNNKMERIIPGTEKPKTQAKTVSATPEPVSQALQQNTVAYKPAYIAPEPIQLADEEFEEIAPRKTKTRRLIDPKESGDGI